MGGQLARTAGDVAAQGLAHAGVLDAAQRALAWLTATAKPAEVPVVPHLASGELPSLTLVLETGAPANESRFVLRMWAVDLELINGSPTPVWVGSALEEHFDRPLSMFTLAWTQFDMNKPRDVVADAIQFKRLAVSNVSVMVSDWDGRVLLIRESSD
jgi:undecaprenyl-diphosphatase